jgi:hypothetical protein
MIVRNFISDVGFAAAGVVELRPQLCPALIMGTACTFHKYMQTPSMPNKMMLLFCQLYQLFSNLYKQLHAQCSPAAH